MKILGKSGLGYVGGLGAVGALGALGGMLCGFAAYAGDQAIVCRSAAQNVDQQIERRYQDQIIFQRLMPVYDRVIGVDPATLNRGSFLVRDFDGPSTDWIGLDAECITILQRVRVSRTVLALWDLSQKDLFANLTPSVRSTVQPNGQARPSYFGIEHEMGMQTYLFARWSVLRSRGMTARAALEGLRAEEAYSAKMMTHLASDIQPTSGSLYSAYGSLLAALVPGLRTTAFDRESAAPSVKSMNDDLGELSWKAANALSPRATSDDEIYLEGDALRYLLAPVRDIRQADPKDFLAQLQSLRLTRTGKFLTIEIKSAKPTYIKWLEASTSLLYRILGINAPKSTSLKLGVVDGIVSIWDVKGLPNAPSASVKYVGLFGDTIFLKQATIDLLTGKSDISLGALNNSLWVIAEGSVQARKLMGIKWWESIKLNALGGHFDVTPPALRSEPRP